MGFLFWKHFCKFSSEWTFNLLLLHCLSALQETETILVFFGWTTTVELTDWRTDWLTDWLTDRLTDWRRFTWPAGRWRCWADDTSSWLGVTVTVRVTQQSRSVHCCWLTCLLPLSCGLPTARHHGDATCSQLTKKKKKRTRCYCVRNQLQSHHHKPDLEQHNQLQPVSITTDIPDPLVTAAGQKKTYQSVLKSYLIWTKSKHVCCVNKTLWHLYQRLFFFSPIN